MNQPETPDQNAEESGSGSASIVLVRFASRRAAERMVASLGRDFRRKVHKGKAMAFVVTHNQDGSFTLVQSRVLTSRGLAVSVTKFTAGVLTGLGVLMSVSALGGAKTATHAARHHQSHVGRENKRLAELLDHLGPKAACVLFHCTDDATGQIVAAQARKRIGDNLHYSRTEFLTVLDQLGGGYDWVRPVVAEPTPRLKKHSKSHT